MRALVTGAAGFLGSYMTRELVQRGIEVLATSLPGAAPGAIPATADAPRWTALDVREAEAVDRTVQEFSPDVVYHFAGLAFVIPSWQDPEGTFRTNVLGTLHLLESLRRHRPDARFAFAGSGTQYGDPEQVPTPEDAPMRPTSPYASSKAAADLLCYQYFRSFGIPVVRYRIFGTTGVGKVGDSINDFASQIARLEHQPAPRVMRVGNLDKARDVTDVRDATRAMIAVAERGEAGTAYNIGSGVPRTVRTTLDTLRGFAAAPIEVEVDPSRVRRVDEPVHLADVRRLRALGWSPEISFEETLRETLDAWRATVARAPGA